MATFTTAAQTGPKPVDTLILDAGPILSSAAAPSFYLASAERILTTPAVIAEIRDAAARSRFETIWKPFVTLRTPKPESLKVVAEFAKKTGDYAVLSKTDLGLVALGYECELEVAGGDWRLREAPGKEPRGPLREGWGWEGRILKDEKEQKKEEEGENGEGEKKEAEEAEKAAETGEKAAEAEEQKPEEELSSKLESVNLSSEATTEVHAPTEVDVSDSEDSDSDSEGWITPSNLHKHMQSEPEPNANTASLPANQQLSVALATTDFALQNVTLQLNLHLLSPTSLARITHTRSTVLRCHACFYILRQPQTAVPSAFCPRCGGAQTLLRTTCSTDKDGVFRIHLKRNFQWKNRGNVYSLPKPHHGTASGKGVARVPILREDQKEYERARRREGYRKEKDMMDQDYLPDILTGNRKWGNDIALGVGRRNPNQVRRGGGKKRK